MTEERNDKLRAVFLAAIMALSMVAIGASALGGVAADGQHDAIANDDPDQFPDDKAESTAEGFEITDGLTVLDDFAANGSSVLPDDTDNTESPLLFTNPIGAHDSIVPVVGEHLALSQLPVQTDEYEDLAGFLNYQQANPDAVAHADIDPNVTQTTQWDFDVVANDGEEESIYIDISNALAIGLMVNVQATEDEFGNFSFQLQDQLHDDGDNLYISDGDEVNQVIGTAFDNAAGEIRIDYEADANVSVSGLEVSYVWQAMDPVNGLAIDDGDHRVDLILRGEDSTEQDRFRVVDVGATALSPADAGTGVLDQTDDGNTVGDISLSANRNVDGHVINNTDTLAFHVWAEQGQDITFIGNEADDAATLYEVDTFEEGDEEWYQLGGEIASNSGNPGQAFTWNVDDLGLEPGERYFLQFDSNEDDEVIVLDVAELDLQAEVPDQVIATQDLEIEVSSADRDNPVQAWFWEESDWAGENSLISDVVHVERGELDGVGEETLRVVPEDDLDVEGEYRAMVIHDRSEVFIPTESFEVIEPGDAEVDIVTPDGDEVIRGDIVPIELELENTNLATVTFGDRDPEVANVEINVTLQDIDGSGTVSMYLNTFQVGHGYNYNATTPTEPDRNTGEDLNFTFSRNHGFFTLDPGTALVGQDGQEALAHPNIDIRGGSQAHEVLGSISYELRAVAGDDPWTVHGQLDDLSVMRVVEPGSEQLEAHVAPGEGENEIDPEFVDDIAEGVDEGYIAPAAGEVADKDMFIVEFGADGLTGVFHDRILRSEELGDEELSDADLFFRENDIVSDLVFGTDDIEDEFISIAPTIEQIEGVPVNVEEIVVEGLENERLLGGTYDDLNFDRFYLLVHLDRDELEVSTDDPLDFDSLMQATFTLDVTWGGVETIPENALRQDTVTVNEEFLFVEPTAFIDRSGITWNPELNRVEIPAGTNVTIPGRTNVAPGSNLTIQVLTEPGAEDAAFFEQFQDTFPTFADDGLAMNQTWDVTVAENFDIGDEMDQMGVSQIHFDIQIFRQGSGIIAPGGQAIPGVVLEEPAVAPFVFDDQQSTGSSVLVQEITMNHGGYVYIYNDAGDRIGESGHLQGGVDHQNVAISIDELDDGEHELTAVAMQDADNAYPDGERTATVTVGVEELDPAFIVNNVDLTPSEIENPGDEVTATAQVTNIGGEGEQELTLSVDGTQQDSTTLTLDSDATDSVEFSVDTADLQHGQSYSVEVASDDASSEAFLTVAEEEVVDEDDEDDEVVDEDDTDDEVVDEDEDDADDDGAGFGVIVAALALIGAAMLAVRRAVQE